MFQRLTDVVTREQYFQDTIDQTQYKRSVCALAWPMYPKAGCVLVLAERRFLPLQMDAEINIDVKAETFSDDTSVLLDAVDRLQVAFKFNTVVTPCDDEREVQIEYENDKRRRERKAVIRVQHPISWSGKGEGLLPYYVSMLHRRIVQKKTLHFTQHSQLPTDIRAILGKDTALAQTTSMLQYPSLCALCWALESIEASAPHDIDTGGVLMGAADTVGGY